MVTLLNNCNLGISLDTKSNTILLSEDVVTSPVQTISLLSLLPTLLNKSLSYPRDVYNEYNTVYHHDDEDLAQSDVGYDIIYLPPGLLGIEYIKSHIYYSPKSNIEGSYSTIVEVLHGKLTIILQKNKQPVDEFEFETSVSKGYIIKVSQGEKCAIPKGYFFTFVNSSELPVIFVKINKGTSHADYNLLKREGGLAYYCIRKNAREEIVLNPRYRDTPKIKRLKSDFFLDDLHLNWSSPLYEILKAEKQILSHALCSNCN